MFTEKNKKINRLTLKHVLFLITYTIALIWIMLHLNEVFDTVSMIIGMLRPFIYGIMMAFVFNIPMKFFLKKASGQSGKVEKGARRCMLAADYFRYPCLYCPHCNATGDRKHCSIGKFTAGLYRGCTENDYQYDRETADTTGCSQAGGHLFRTAAGTLVNLLKNGIPHLLTMASGFASSLANVFMALVIAVYLTVSKDKLLEQSHRFLYAFTSSRANAFVLRVAHLTNTTFSAFITGQLVEAVIIGVLCYIGCLVLGSHMHRSWV